MSRYKNELPYLVVDLAPINDIIWSNIPSLWLKKNTVTLPGILVLKLIRHLS